MFRKSKIPYHLLCSSRRGDPLDVDCYLAEISHSLKLVAYVAVPTESVKTNTLKRGWSDFPGLKEAKVLHRF